jgi:hypothetical protein
MVDSQGPFVEAVIGVNCGSAIVLPVDSRATKAMSILYAKFLQADCGSINKRLSRV